MPTPRVRVPVDFPPELDEWLRAQAAGFKTSRNALIVGLAEWFQRAVNTGDKDLTWLRERVDRRG